MDGPFGGACLGTHAARTPGRQRKGCLGSPGTPPALSLTCNIYRRLTSGKIISFSTLTLSAPRGQTCVCQTGT